MKIWLFLPMALLAFAATAICDQLYTDNIARILKDTPVFSQDELKQTIFSGTFLPPNYAPGSFQWALYNPSRNKSIQGIVVNVHGKDASSGQEQNIDLFILVECAPLQCTEGQPTFTALAELAKQSPTIVLKEVHYTSLQEASSAKGS